MMAEGRKEGLCDLSNVVAFGHNEQWRPKAARVATKFAKITELRLGLRAPPRRIT